MKAADGLVKGDKLFEKISQSLNDLIEGLENTDVESGTTEADSNIDNVKFKPKEYQENEEIEGKIYKLYFGKNSQK